jgi:hypothetical protein
LDWTEGWLANGGEASSLPRQAVARALLALSMRVWTDEGRGRQQPWSAIVPKLRLPTEREGKGDWLGEVSNRQNHKSRLRRLDISPGWEE